jgi:hypothetical protein
MLVARRFRERVPKMFTTIDSRASYRLALRS